MLIVFMNLFLTVVGFSLVVCSLHVVWLVLAGGWAVLVLQPLSLGYCHGLHLLVWARATAVL